MRFFPFSCFRISGHSMEPALKEGDFVITYNWARPKVGDIVVFDYNGKIMVKRISAIKQSHCHVAGDNKNDSLKIARIKREQIIGKVF